MILKDDGTLKTAIATVKYPDHGTKPAFTIMYVSSDITLRIRSYARSVTSIDISV